MDRGDIAVADNAPVVVSDYPNFGGREWSCSDNALAGRVGQLGLKLGRRVDQYGRQARRANIA